EAELYQTGVLAAEMHGKQKVLAAPRQAAPGWHVAYAHPGPVVLPLAVLPAALDLAQQQRIAGPVCNVAQHSPRPVCEYPLVARPALAGTTARQTRATEVARTTEHRRIARVQNDRIEVGVVVRVRGDWGQVVEGMKGERRSSQRGIVNVVRGTGEHLEARLG